MKKKIFAIALIIICFAAAVYGTTAYFTYVDTATNVITMGNVKIELEELAVPEDGGDPVPFEDVIDVLPGAEVSKIVQVKNAGSESAWVRIAVDKSIELAEGNTGDVDLSLITYDINTEYWTEQDGYFYYNAALESGKTTEPLFTKVMFSLDMGNLYQQSTATVDVSVQAVQAANNGSTVFEAAGWPD